MLSLLFWRTCDSATNLFLYILLLHTSLNVYYWNKRVLIVQAKVDLNSETPQLNDFHLTYVHFMLLDSYLILFFSIFRYGRWVTRKIAVATIIIIWLLAAFVSFVPISFGLHRPDQPVIYLDSGKKYPTCALDLTPTYAVVSSCISFYVPCIVMIGIYCR